MASSVSTAPTLYFDEKWKLSKKEGSTRSRSSSTPLIKNSSQRRCAFASKCARLVKEQRARFYIMRRLKDERVLKGLGGVELFDHWKDHFDPIILLRGWQAEACMDDELLRMASQREPNMDGLSRKHLLL
ncbi:unnamed protein product [Sphenostylis stenocarpa]|uniref:Uncharacterized protein n=1 Tax=Sphenostylis stenocarpa TaxID=92480 RepID=A0AA86VRU0_9FABA|nr:unnamed protein product [Sphenostylis stenocarpa]